MKRKTISLFLSAALLLLAGSNAHAQDADAYYKALNKEMLKLCDEYDELYKEEIKLQVNLMRYGIFDQNGTFTLTDVWSGDTARDLFDQLDAIIAKKNANYARQKEINKAFKAPPPGQQPAEPPKPEPTQSPKPSAEELRKQVEEARTAENLQKQMEEATQRAAENRQKEAAKKEAQRRAAATFSEESKKELKLMFPKGNDLKNLENAVADAKRMAIDTLDLIKRAETNMTARVELSRILMKLYNTNSPGVIKMLETRLKYDLAYCEELIKAPEKHFWNLDNPTAVEESHKKEFGKPMSEKQKEAMQRYQDSPTLYGVAFPIADGLIRGGADKIFLSRKALDGGEVVLADTVFHEISHFQKFTTPGQGGTGYAWATDDVDKERTVISLMFGVTKKKTETVYEKYLESGGRLTGTGELERDLT